MKHMNITSKFLIFVGFIILLVSVKNSFPAHNLEDRIEKLTSDTANAYFEAGVQSAISAHLDYVKSELVEGRLPSVASQPVAKWRVDARHVWLTNSLSEHYIKE